MKSMVKLLRKHPIIGIILGIVIGSVSVVIAESIHSNEVLYDNSNSPTSHDNVQDVLDDVYNIIDHNSTSFSLLAHTPTNITTDLQGGLYRYQSADNNIYNYICFGTTNKTECTSESGKFFMYRIIGVSPNGQMKLIKKEPLTSRYKWNNTGVTSTWANSALFNGLNGSYYLTNTTYIPDSSWSDRIAVTTWPYGEITNIELTASELYNIESEYSTTVDAKISLMNIYDFYFAVPGNINCKSNANLCRWSWISKENCSYSPDGYSHEWFMTKYNSSQAWYFNTSVYYTGYSSNSYPVRPVFFLKASERIVSGTGTLADPYILSA